MSNNKVNISQEFKRQYKKAKLALSYFICSFLLILSILVFFICMFFHAGWYIISISYSWLLFFFGLGWILFGVIVTILLLKLIFKIQIKIKPNLNLIEIKIDDEPELFKIIKEIANEINVNVPQKIYISSDNNAYVNFNSSFWSLLFPAKSHLIIGIRLINTVTKFELKSIIAHEFGHFSQKRIQIANFVNKFNDVIYDLLYDRQSYNKFLQNFEKIEVLFIFTICAAYILELIFVILKIIYKQINIHFYALSRELELHADRIAVSITGGEALKNVLLRSIIVEDTWEKVLFFYDEKIDGNIASQNLYKDQLALMNVIAKENNIKIVNGLPLISSKDIEKFLKSKLVINNQRDSHPTIDERIANLKQNSYIQIRNDDSRASELIMEISIYEQHFSKIFWEAQNEKNKPKLLDTEQFIQEYKKSITNDSFPSIFRHYYDIKTPLIFDFSEIVTANINLTFDELYSDLMINYLDASFALENDIQTLRLISDKIIKINNFNYDGVKYGFDEAGELINKLELNLKNLNEKIKLNDIEIYYYFKLLATKQNLEIEFESLYSEYFEFQLFVYSKFEFYAEFEKDLFFTSVKTEFVKIIDNFSKIEPNEETLKNDINILQSDLLLENEITNETKEIFDIYTTSKLEYFREKSYNTYNLRILNSVRRSYLFLLSRKLYLLKKRLLEFQANLYTNSFENL